MLCCIEMHCTVHEPTLHIYLSCFISFLRQNRLCYYAVALAAHDIRHLGLEETRLFVRSQGFYACSLVYCENVL